MSEHRPAYRQKKSLGQVFLREDWPCRKMLEQLNKHHVQRVVEIGPGSGVLTRILLAAGMDVVAIEKDSRFATRLASLCEQPSPSGRLQVITGDVLKFDLGSWRAKNQGPKIAVCGNIPYNISSPILAWLLPHLNAFSLACLMVQLEFAERLASRPATKSYGSLTVYAQLRAKVHLECKVPRTAFSPVPKVDSGIITLKPLQEPLPTLTLQKIEQVTRKAFSQRRKKLSNSLSAFLKPPRAANFPFDLGRRADSLSPQEFVSIVRVLGLDAAKEDEEL